MHYSRLLLVIVFIIATSLHATPIFDLKTALDIGLSKAPSLQVQAQDLYSKKANYRLSLSQENPSVQASFLPQGSRSKIDLSFDQNLMRWITSPLENEAIDSQLESDSLLYKNAVAQLKVEVKKAFYAIQAAQALLVIQNDYTQAAQTTFELTKRQFEAGNINELQLKTNEVACQEALTMTHEKELSLQIAEWHLQETMGLAPTHTINLVTGTLSETLPQIPSFDELDRLIETQRPDLAALYAQIRAEKAHSLTQEWQNKLGNLKAGIQFEQEVDGTQSLGPKIEFSLPFLNQGQAAFEAHGAVIAYLNSLLITQKHHAQYAIRKCVSQLQYESIEIIRTKTHLIPLHQRINELTQKQYNYMLMGVFSLIQAKQEELKAQETYVQHLASFWNAWAELEGQVGSIPTKGTPQ